MRTTRRRVASVQGTTVERATEEAGASELPTSSAPSTVEAAPKASSRRSPGAKKAPPPGLSLAVEQGSWARGLTRVVGVDEAGRGPLAGPVVAAAYCHPPGVPVVPGVRDSKLMTEEQREEAYELLIRVPGAAWATCFRSAKQVDEENVLRAAMTAMSGAVRSLGGRPDVVLVDGNRIPEGIQAWVDATRREDQGREGAKEDRGVRGEGAGKGAGKEVVGEGQGIAEGDGNEAECAPATESEGLLPVSQSALSCRSSSLWGEGVPQGEPGRAFDLSGPSSSASSSPLAAPSVRCIIKGDSKVYSIAAASVIAKVTRDRRMLELDAIYPSYGFALHKGYGVPAHMRALSKHGPCPEHRVTYAPVKRALEAQARAQNGKKAPEALGAENATPAPVENGADRGTKDAAPTATSSKGNVRKRKTGRGAAEPSPDAPPVGRTLRPRRAAASKSLEA